MYRLLTTSVLSIVAALWLSGCRTVPSLDTRRAGDEQSVRTIVGALVNALNNADDDRIMALFSPQASVFFPLPESAARVQGTASLRAAFSAFFSDVRRQGSGPPYSKLSPQDIDVTVFGDVALVTFHLSGKIVLSRRTLVLSRHESGWFIEHLHASNIRLDTQ